MSDPFTKKSLFFTVTAQGGGEGFDASCTITTSTPDRGADVVASGGAKIANYLKNPVVLFGHDYRAIPVGHCTELAVADNQITAKWKWLQGDAFADRVKNAWDQGVLRATSIGLNPMKWGYDEERRGYDFLEWDLLEFSICPVPMNPEAVRTMSAQGVDLTGIVEEAANKLTATIKLDASELTAAIDRLEALRKAVPQTIVTPDPADTDELTFELVDDDPNTFDVSDAELQSVLRDVVTSTLRNAVTAAAQQALAHASGRVD